MNKDILQFLDEGMLLLFKRVQDGNVLKEYMEHHDKKEKC